MDAKELYEMSLKHKNSKNNRPDYWGLSVRLSGCLRRAGFLAGGRQDAEKEIRDLVTSGNIWMIRRIGKVGVMELCEWLASESDFQKGKE